MKISFNNINVPLEAKYINKTGNSKCSLKQNNTLLATNSKKRKMQEVM